MPKAAAIKWGTNPAVKFGKTSDPLNAKGKLTELFQSGEIDVNNWTTKLLATSYPDLKLTRFPESTVRTHCNKVCAQVIHQRGLDQQARLLGRRNNNSNNNADGDEDDEDVDEQEEDVEEAEEEEAPDIEDTPPNASTHSTPNHRPRMSTSSKASSSRRGNQGSRGYYYDDDVDDVISELGMKLGTHGKISPVIDDTTIVTVYLDDEVQHCHVWQDPIHKCVFTWTDPNIGEAVRVQLVGVETLGALVASNIEASFIEDGGGHIVLVKSQSGLGQ